MENWQQLLFSEQEEDRALALAMLPIFDFEQIANPLAISYLKLYHLENWWGVSCIVQTIIDYFQAHGIDIFEIFERCPHRLDDISGIGQWWSDWVDKDYEATAAYFSKAQLLALGARRISWIWTELLRRTDWHHLLTADEWRQLLATCIANGYLALLNMRNLERLPEAIFECRELRGLTIYAPLLSFPVGLLYQLQNLEALHLHNCNLKSLDIDLRRLPKLRALTFRGKEKLLKLNIEGREQLERLDLFGNPVMRLPLWIRDLSGLWLLNIGKMNFTSFPPAVLALKNLQDLSVSETRFTNFPDAFAQMRALRVLDISGGHFSRLPDFFADFEHLADINISRCNFKEIPLILAAMPALHRLDISNNFIRSIDFDNLRPLFARLTWLNARNAISTPELLAELEAVAREFPKLRLDIK